MLAAWLNARYRAVWWVLFVAFALPAAELGARYFARALGPNPLEALLRGTGRDQVHLLIVCTASLELGRLTARQRCELDRCMSPSPVILRKTMAALR